MASKNKAETQIQSQSNHEMNKQAFEYDNNQSQFMNLPEYRSKSPTKTSLLTKTQIEINLREIYTFYSQAYIQPRKKLQTFDKYQTQSLNFQSFLLFFIFSLEKLKIFFKKFSNFGKYLTFDNFHFLLASISHQPQSQQFFKIEAAVAGSGMDLQAIQQLEKQQFYSYLNIGEPQIYRKNFKTFFQPFNCASKAEIQKIQFKYRKFSLPQLKEKAMPVSKQKKLQSSRKFALTRQQKLQNMKEKQSEIKNILVSWQILNQNRSKSVLSLKKTQQLIGKKYIKYDIDDDVYLQEYDKDSRGIRAQLAKKIKEIQQIEDQKNQILIQKAKKYTNKTYK